MRYRLVLDWEVDEDELFTTSEGFIREDCEPMTDEQWRRLLIEACVRDYGERIDLDRVA